MEEVKYKYLIVFDCPFPVLSLLISQLYYMDELKACFLDELKQF